MGRRGTALQRSQHGDSRDEWTLGLTQMALGSSLHSQLQPSPPPKKKKTKENQEDPEEAYLARPLLAVEEDNLLHK